MNGDIIDTLSTGLASWQRWQTLFWDIEGVDKGEEARYSFEIGLISWLSWLDSARILEE